MKQNDFATEYKDFIRADVPDLWDRIEAKIDALGQEDNKKPEAEKPAETAEVKQTQQEETNVRPETKIRKFRWQPYAGIAVAAVLCLAVLIPAMTGARMSGSTASPQADSAPAAATSEAYATGGDVACEAAACAETNAETSGPRSNQEKDSMTYSHTLGVDSFGAMEEAEDGEMETAAAGDAVSETAESIEAGAEAETSGTAPGAGSGTILWDGREVTNDSLLIEVVPGTTKEDVEKLCEKYRMEIRYAYEDMEMYSLGLFSPVKDETELRELIEILEKEKMIKTVSPDALSYPDEE